MQLNSDLEYINQYLRGELDERDRSLFEKRLKEDPAFAEEVKLHQKVKEVVLDENTHRLDQVLKDIRREWERKPTATQPVFAWLKTPYRVAAAIVLIMAAGALAYIALWPSHPSSQELFSIYYQPSPLSLQRGLENPPELEKAFGHYQKSEYNRALDYFEDPAVVTLSSIKVEFYKAHCYLNTGEIERSIKSFEEVIQHGDNVYMKPAHWYLALSYLKANDRDTAKKLLMEIGEGNMFEGVAERLLKDL